MSRRLFILDANALLHRAWHALPPLTSPTGQIVNAVYGVVNVMLKLIEEQKPDAFVACWDTKAPTFRHEAYEAYKAQREKQPDELYAQIPLIQRALTLLGVESFSMDGFEADDLLGTIAVGAAKDGWDVTIVTGDRDALQLIGQHISVLTFKKGVSETLLYDEKMLYEVFGLTPEQFLEYKILRGDPSDNIPGVKGIGEKGATELLQTYGSIEGMMRAAHDTAAKLSPSLRQKLLTSESELPGLRDLVTIRTDVPFSWSLETLAEKPLDVEAWRSFLQEMGFNSLLKRSLGKDSEQKKTGSKMSAESVADHPTKGKKATTYTSSILVEEVAKNEADAKKKLAQLSESPELVIMILEEAPDSLFGNEAYGIAVADRERCIVFRQTELKIPAIQTALNELFAEQKQLIAHDAKAAMHGLRKLGLTPPERWEADVLLAGYLLSAGDRVFTLNDLAARYELNVLADRPTPCAIASLIRALNERQKTELAEASLDKVLRDFELPLIPVLYRMECHGILIDRPYLGELSVELGNEKRRLEKAMQEAAGTAFNPASPSQLADVLFTHLKLPTKGIKKGKTGYSTAASELDKLRGQHPLVELVEEYREVSKLLSTYVETLPTMTDAEGRIHTTFHQAVAATGRLSSMDPNVQNIPIRTETGRRIRHAFVASPGYTLLSCDYSQIELRVVAALANDKRMKEAFNLGHDIHTDTAAAIWGVSLEAVTKEQRRIAKAINFGIIFGQGPHGLSQVAGISYADAKQFIETYFTIYSGVKVFMETTKDFVRKNGYAETLFGRRRLFPDIQSPLPQLRAQAERMAINMPVQGTDADLMKLAMIEVDALLPSLSPKSRLLLQVHDELVLEVLPDELERVAKAIKQTMEQIREIGVPILVEAKAGPRWDEMKAII
ncbi:DNA polymerase I [Patescibacteria group bacterium]|nr:DNA polymerase I [Patescibacteria group bacterium]